MKKMLAMLLLCSGIIFAQGLDTPIDPNGDPSGIPPDLFTFNLSSLLASGANYSGYLPSGEVDFEIENLGNLPSTVWVVYRGENGEKQLRYVFTPVGGKTTVAGDELNDCEVFLISIQPFSLTTQIPVKTVGPPSRHVSVKQAPRSMELRLVETSGGVAITVGVDLDGNAHFPAHGRIIGRVRGNGAVFLNSGRVLHPAR